MTLADAHDLLVADQHRFADASVNPIAPAEAPLPARTRDRSSPKQLLSAGLAAAAAIVMVVVGFTVVDRLEDRDVIEASVFAPSPGDNDAVLVQSTGRGFDRSTDLLVVHFDFADRSDAHAAVAALEVATWFKVDPVVIAGTQSADAGGSVYAYAEVMDAVWDDRWLDASAGAAALDQSVARWITTLDAGGQVWVAEGGVLDFTAQVLRELVQQRPALDTQTLVHVLHRSGSASSDLAFVQASTNYVLTDRADGLSDPSDDFEASVLSGMQRDRWAAAFAVVPSSALDLSDAALLFEALDVSTDDVANANDFAAFFIGDQPDAHLRGDG